MTSSEHFIRQVFEEMVKYKPKLAAFLDEDGINIFLKANCLVHLTLLQDPLTYIPMNRII